MAIDANLGYDCYHRHFLGVYNPKTKSCWDVPFKGHLCFQTIGRDYDYGRVAGGIGLLLEWHLGIYPTRVYSSAG